MTEANAESPVADRMFNLEEAELERLWRADGIDLSPTQIKLLPEIRRWLGRRKANPLADFLVGKPVETLSPAITKELTADILARFRPQKQGVEAVSLLTKVIDRGNAEGTFYLCPPPIPVLVRRQPSPFREDRWPALDVAQRLRALLEQSIRDPGVIGENKRLPEVAARIKLGQIITSAVVHGGLVSASILESLTRRLGKKASPVELLGERLFIEFSLSYQKQPNAEYRRWYPDALTAVLLMSLPPDIVAVANGKEPLSDNGTKKFIWRCLTAFLNSVGQRKTYPKSLSALLDAVRLDLECRIPIFLAHYAARTFVSHSLKPSVYRRMHGLPVNIELDRADSTSPSEDLGPPGVGIRQDTPASADVEPRWLGSLRSAMTGDDRAEICSRIKNLLDEPAPGFAMGEPGELFGGFARRSFSVANENKMKMAVSTARGVVIAVSKRLGGLVGQDISNFGAEEWSGLYEEALGDAETPTIRRKLVRALRDFQRYLELERGAETISGGEVFAASNGLVPVDANIITDVEFLKIRERFTAGISDELPGIVSSQDGDKLAEVAWLILTLSYRCGLRRMEVLKLELDDLTLEGREELLVRPTEARRLKTKSSTRKIPLHALLNDEEMARLTAWAKARHTQEERAAYARFLFSIPGRGFVFVPQDTLFRLLHKVMREATGDPTLRFHHLRHSFASRTLVCLAVSSGMSARRIQSVLPGYAEPLAHAEEIRLRLFGDLRMTRRDVWAVCSLLGHSGPDISVEHYVHHLDILLAEAMTRPGISPNTATVIVASGAASASAYRHRKDSLLDEWVSHLYLDKVEENKPAPAAVVTVVQEKTKAPPKEIDDAGLSLMRIWRQLLVTQTTRRTPEDVAARNGIELALLERYIESAIWLSNLKLSETGSGFRHRFIEWTPDRRERKEKRRIACPVKPLEARDIAAMSRMATAFRVAYRKDRILLRRFVERYAIDVRPAYGGLVFTDPSQAEDAKDFVRCLKLLGFSNAEIEYVSFDKSSKKSIPAAAWRRALGIHSSIEIRKALPPNGNSQWACPWLGIQPVFPIANKKNDKQKEMIGSAGFRFVMVMAAIAMGMKGN